MELTMEEIRCRLEQGSEEVWLELEELCRIVQTIHYPHSRYREDLIHEGLLASVGAIMEFCPTVEVRSPRSYLYTKIRNTMSNWCYHNNKETVFLGDIEDTATVETFFNVDVDIDEEICNLLDLLPDVYKDYEHALRLCMRSLIHNMVICCPKDKNPETLARLATLTIWRIKDQLEEGY